LGRTLVRLGANKTDIYIDVSLYPIRCPSLWGPAGGLPPFSGKSYIEH